MHKVDPKWIRGKVDELAIEQGCYFDDRAAKRVCDFIEIFCRKTKGRGDRKVTLIPWQRDFVSRLFGWMTSKGTRRYRAAYLELPKKQGKSFLMSAIALYMLLADGEGSPEVYLAATNSKQARIIFDECVKMIKSSPTLLKRIGLAGIRDTLKQIKYRPNFGKVECATLDSDAMDGWDASCSIIDEYHRHKTSKLMDVLRYAGSAREQPLLLTITTAGNDRNSPCWDEHEKAIKVITGDSKDTTLLAIVYGADRDKDDLDSPEVWKRVNPSIGYTMSEEDFRRDFEAVKESPSGLNNFLRLRFNIWTQPESSYISPDHWAKGNTPIRLEDLEGLPCWCGMDISSKRDITAFVMLFGHPDTGLIAVPKFWIPRTEARERQLKNDIRYSEWERDGFVTLTPGAAIDYDLVEAEIRDLAKRYKFKSITSDDWGGSEAVGQRLKSAGLRLSFMGQGYRSMSEVTKELERLCIMGKFQHGGHPILRWMNENAIVRSDPAGNIKLEKPNKDSPFKIDGLIATLEALYGMQAQLKRGNVYALGKSII